MRALALLYHDVVPARRFEASGFRTIGADRYKMPVEQFDKHIAAIAASTRRKAVRITDENWQQSFLFTVDDGGCSGMHVADRLEARDWRGHFFVTTNYIGSPGFLNKSEIRELAARGHVIGSHTCSHPIPMGHCTPQRLFTEWNESRQKLEHILGNRVVTASLPGGSYKLDIARSAADAGVWILFNSEPTRRVYQVKNCRIIGRYRIIQSTTPNEAGKLARGNLIACAKQQAFWNAKKLLKRFAARPYDVARNYMLQRR